MKTDNTFLKTLDKAERRISRMREHIRAIRWLYENGDMEEAYEQAMKLEEQSERTVLLTRSLPVYTGNPIAAADVENLMALSIPVDVGFTAENWFSVRIPLLLPKKVEGSADYIRSLLYPAMREFFMKQAAVRYRDCVLIYRHVYDRSRPQRQKRDHDNIEVNMASDIIAMYVMPDDGPEVCSHYYCSAAGSEDRTEIYVVPRADFPMWLITEKAMPEEGVKLYEERLL